jgi:MarR family transcriptional regulator, transcriptional regulator for hemolysin
MPPRIDPDTIGFLVTDLSRLIRAEFDKRIAQTGLPVTAGEARTLVHAARAGEIRQNALAEQMGVEAMTVSGYLDRLEARGLVERRPDPADRRAKLVGLTEAAGGVLAEIATVAASVRAEASKGLSTADWARLLDMMKTVRANLAAAARTDAGQGRAA